METLFGAKIKVFYVRQLAHKLRGSNIMNANFMNVFLKTVHIYVIIYIQAHKILTLTCALRSHMTRGILY